MLTVWDKSVDYHCISSPRKWPGGLSPPDPLGRMIGKLEDKYKGQWPRHLSKLTHAYNSTRSTITGYSPHFLMFG